MIDKNNNNKKQLLLQEYYGTTNSYEIYPSYWKKSWGAKPLLGFVKADNEYYAKYAAYDSGLIPPNATFEPEPVKSERRPVKLIKTYRKQ